MKWNKSFVKASEYWEIAWGSGGFISYLCGLLLCGYTSHFVLSREVNNFAFPEAKVVWRGLKNLRKILFFHPLRSDHENCSREEKPLGLISGNTGNRSRFQFLSIMPSYLTVHFGSCIYLARTLELNNF